MRLTAVLSAAVVAAVAFGATAVVAQQNPIEARQALMKDNGKHAKLGAAMVKGEKPFDLAAAKEIFVTFEKSVKAADLFPPDSKTGHDTTAAPKIWENMDDFKAKFVKFGADAKAAEASVKDLDSLKAALGVVGKNCGGCHETYRIKKS